MAGEAARALRRGRTRPDDDAGNRDISEARHGPRPAHERRDEVSPKPSTLDLLRAHADIRQVLSEVLAEVRKSEKLSDALDASLNTDPLADNVRARFLSKRVAYEITF